MSDTPYSNMTIWALEQERDKILAELKTRYLVRGDAPDRHPVCEADGCELLIQRHAAAPEERTWIPVSERLPDEKGHYLTVVKAVLDGALVRSQLYKPSAHKAFSGWTHNPVTHWQPLPQLPPTMNSNST